MDLGHHRNLQQILSTWNEMNGTTRHIRLRGVLWSSFDVAQIGFTLLLGRDVNWKSIGASVERSAFSLVPIASDVNKTVSVSTV